MSAAFNGVVVLCLPLLWWFNGANEVIKENDQLFVLMMFVKCACEKHLEGSPVSSFQLLSLLWPQNQETIAALPLPIKSLGFWPFEILICLCLLSNRLSAFTNHGVEPRTSGPVSTGGRWGSVDLCCSAVNTLTWFLLRDSDIIQMNMWTGDDRGGHNAKSTSGSGWRRMASLWRWRCCCRICLQSLIRGWRDPRTSSMDTTRFRRCQNTMSTVNRNSNNAMPWTPHLTISASAVNNILSVQASFFHMWAHDGSDGAGPGWWWTCLLGL